MPKDEAGASFPDRHAFLRAEVRDDERSRWRMVSAARNRWELEQKAPDVVRRADARHPHTRVLTLNAFDEAVRLYAPHALKAAKNQDRDRMPSGARESFLPMRERSGFDDYEGLAYTLKSAVDLATVDFSKNPDVDRAAFKVLFVWGEK